MIHTCSMLQYNIMTYNSEQSRGEAGHEVLACSGSDDGVVSARHSRTVVSSHHQTHLQELAGIVWQSESGRGGEVGETIDTLSWEDGSHGTKKNNNTTTKDKNPLYYKDLTTAVKLTFSETTADWGHLQCLCSPVEEWKKKIAHMLSAKSLSQL